MKMRVLTYTGAHPNQVSALLDEAGVLGQWRKLPSHVATRRTCPLASGCTWPFCLSTRSSNIGDLDVQ